VSTAIEVGGTSLGGVRLDSGDLVVQASEVREQLDALGATETTIVVTSDLDEYAIAALAAAPVDTYGVGTRVVTGSGHPTASMVYKLVAREDDAGTMIGVAKKSKDKVSVGGRKYALRRRNPLGVVEAEVLGIGEEPVGDADDRDLLVRLVADGEVVGREHATLEAGRARHEASVAELPRSAHQLSQGQPAVETIFLTETP
jgi:nicotinate phosphoribosyltransferase